jgi:hypothetical protein
MSVSLFSQANYWKTSSLEKTLRRGAVAHEIMPTKYDVWQLNYEGLWTELTGNNRSFETEHIISLPYLEGTTIEVVLKSYDLLAPGLAAKYPELKAWKGTGPNGMRVYMNSGVDGFHITLSSTNEKIYVEPLKYNNSAYIVYNVKDFESGQSHGSFSCGVTADEENKFFNAHPELNEDVFDYTSSSRNQRGIPIQLRTYRMAMAVTGALTSFVGGGRAGGLSAAMTVLNRTNEVFEKDLSVTFQMVENNDVIVFTDPDTDPYTDASASTMLDENQTAIDARIGASTYDIGHVIGFTNGSQNGIAQVGSVCGGGKARAVSIANSSPTIDPFIVSIVCHEIGHSFSARHTMTHCHNVNDNSAMEPGSGSTIMSYAGICSPDSRNIQDFADPYFHANSLQSMINFSRFGNGNTCAVVENLGNTEPDLFIESPRNLTIPVSTPFKLEGSAYDAEGDSVSFVWEQYDVEVDEPQETLGSPTGNAPLFRSFPPGPSPIRYFPSLDLLVDNGFSVFQILPTYNRNMSFRFIARDNNIGNGATVWRPYQVSVSVVSGPFNVISPSAPFLAFDAGEQIEVTWDVSRTNEAPINSNIVEIKLSIDGGFTYPYTLDAGTENDGSQTVILPDVRTENARIMVASVDNIFLDISDNDFIISEPSEPGYYLNFENTEELACAPTILEFELPTSSFAGYDEVVAFSVIENTLPGGEVSLASDEIIAGESTSLLVDLQDVSSEGDYTITFQTASSNGIVFERTIDIQIVSNDFSSVSLMEPENGETGLGNNPTFMWTTSPDADFYTFELASSPDFDADMVYMETGIIGGGLSLPVDLVPNQDYYWRIYYTNPCGRKLHPEIFAFKTEAVNCSIYPYAGPLIPINGSQVVRSTINITESGPIGDLNLRNIRGSHAGFNQLSARLEGPTGGQALLFNSVCDGQVAFNFNLDDDAANPVSSCQITTGGTVRPETPLSTFSDDERQGQWELIITDNANDALSGILTSWSIEICLDLDLQNPFLITNDTLSVKTTNGRDITPAFLEAGDDDNESNEIVFTVVTLPEHGILRLRDEFLVLGSTFTQDDINAGRLTYKHTGFSEESDQFLFSIKDVDGGFFGIDAFNININDDEDIVSVDQVEDDSFIRIYPNPANNFFIIELNSPAQDDFNIEIFDFTGRLILERRNVQLDKININTSAIETGLYLVRVESGGRDFVKKVNIQK